MYKTIARIRLPNVYRTSDAVSIWQKLFDIYCQKGGDIRHMGNMMFDFKKISEKLESFYTDHPDGFRFWWSYHGLSRTELVFDSPQLYSNDFFGHNYLYIWFQYYGCIETEIVDDDFQHTFTLFENEETGND